VIQHITSSFPEQPKQLRRQRNIGSHKHDRKNDDNRNARAVWQKDSHDDARGKQAELQHGQCFPRGFLAVLVGDVE